MNDFSIQKPIPYYEQFYHSIKKMIFEGTFKPGERIIENQLAKEFGVSKSPIREAIRMLENEGLVVTDEKSRVKVYEPAIQDVEEIYFCRMALESFAVERMTSMATEEEIQAIRQLLQETAEAIENERSAEVVVTLNERFHHLIIAYTQNKRLQKQLDGLKSLTHFFRILNLEGENRAEVILEQHHKIFGYIQNREGEKAAEEMISHLKLDLDHLKEVLPEETENQK